MFWPIDPPFYNGEKLTFTRPDGDQISGEVIENDGKYWFWYESHGEMVMSEMLEIKTEILEIEDEE